MKLCTVVAYYITSITKQLKFPNPHCTIVCSYSSVVCLTANNEPRNDRIFKKHEIRKVDSPFNEESKNIFFSGRP